MNAEFTEVMAAIGKMDADRAGKEFGTPVTTLSVSRVALSGGKLYLRMEIEHTEKTGRWTSWMSTMPLDDVTPELVVQTLDAAHKRLDHIHSCAPVHNHDDGFYIGNREKEKI